MKKSDLTIAVVGASGAVGREMLHILEKREFPFSSLRLFSSERSRGKKLSCSGREWECEVLETGCFDGVDFAFFDASDEVSKRWAKEAARSGAIVIDNSGAYRMDPETPLVVPEVNPNALEGIGPGALIAGPNCTTVQLVVALKPLHEAFGLKRVIMSTYQSVSGAGTAALEELRSQSSDVLQGKEPRAVELKHPIAFNCIPQIGSFLSGDDAGTTSEEKKVILETRKIMGLPNLAITCTAVRVPTLACHAESVLCEFEKNPDPLRAREVLSTSPGVQVLDDPSAGIYPMNLQGERNEAVFVGRIRKDPSHANGLQFWVVSDNLWKGAALNAVQIAESILQ